jgi:hypothetical protein
MSNATWTRNTAGLRSAVLRRAEEARARAEAAIESLVRDNRPVNFNTVAARARVTRAYLYTHTSLRERIISLR